MFSAEFSKSVPDFFLIFITVSLNGGSHKQWQSYHAKFGLPLKTLGVAALVVPGVIMLEAEDGEVVFDSWWEDCMGRTTFLCNVFLLQVFHVQMFSVSFFQVRNYTECACVQSRQVITPPTVGQRSQLRLVIVKTYLNENGYAVSGKCDRTCNTLIPFLIFLFIVTLITACAQPSAIIVTLR